MRISSLQDQMVSVHTLSSRFWTCLTLMHHRLRVLSAFSLSPSTSEIFFGEVECKEARYFLAVSSRTSFYLGVRFSLLRKERRQEMSWQSSGRIKTLTGILDEVEGVEDAFCLSLGRFPHTHYTRLHLHTLPLEVFKVPFSGFPCDHLWVFRDPLFRNQGPKDTDQILSSEGKLLFPSLPGERSGQRGGRLSLGRGKREGRRGPWPSGSGYPEFLGVKEILVMHPSFPEFPMELFLPTERIGSLGFLPPPEEQCPLLHQELE
ncbi:MAG: hypothetical protein QXT77_01285 [Candidatus Methanomethylicaceae archaeon]